jgi:DNA repair exonuclease SbcCD ATPase subunit
MFVGIGFLLAGLLVIGVIPLVHARAVRLTTRRLEALNPLSMAEIQADKDLLRAEFAMSTHRLEMRVEEIKAKATDHLTEVGKKSEAIGRLKLELGEKTAALLALGAKERQLADGLESTQADLAVKAGALEETERALASTEAELAEVRAKLPRSLVTADSRSLVTADSKRPPLSRPKNSMRALLSVLEEGWAPSKDTHPEQVSGDRAGRASRLRQVSITRGH